MTVFMDGNRVTPGTEDCKCGPDCGCPCWQRIGMTCQPCCKDCPSLCEYVNGRCVVCAGHEGAP